MPFAAIYVPDFSVEALVRAEPELRERALAVVEGTPPLLIVIGVNERARQGGVETGMTALQAEERLSAGFANAGPSTRAPHHPSKPKNRLAGDPGKPGALAQDDTTKNWAWLIRRRSPAQEQAAHAALLDCACAFSPRVEDTAADTVLLDVAGLERLFGPPARLAREVARRVSEVGMEANVAIAANPDAALHAARGFAGVTVIPSSKEAERLGELPTDVLFAAESGRATPELEMLETLDRWGVRNLRALAALPEVAVTQRLGQEGLRLQRLARGEGWRPLRVAEPPLKFEEAVELEYPVALLEPLAFLLNRMLEQLCARLAARALAAQELRLRLELDPAEEDVSRFAFHVSRDPNQRETRNRKRETLFARAIKLPVPMLDAKIFLKLLQLDLQAHPPGAPVTKIWLEAEPAEPRWAQTGLFIPATPEPEKLELTLARIKGVVGVGAGLRPTQHESKTRAHTNPEPRVGSPEVLDTHRPDTFRMNAFNPFAMSCGRGSVTRADRSAGSADTEHRQSPLTAMRILRPPLAIMVEMRDGTPGRISERETRNGKRETLFGEILWAAGPWRSSGDWWDEQAWAREEWDVAVKNAEAVALYRIYRDQRSGTWFVEAEYD